MRYLRVPADRLAVVIGHDGATRKHIEKRLGVKIDVDTGENEVLIHDEVVEDPLGPLKAEEIIKAIARGFSPERAMRLVGDDVFLQVFDMHDYGRKDHKDVQRLSSRVIGTEGKTRRIIEDLTGCWLSVYGHTVALIGDLESIDIAKTAVDMLLSGAEHASVYRFLENKRREFKRQRVGF